MQRLAIPLACAVLVTGLQAQGLAGGWGPAPTGPGAAAPAELQLALAYGLVPARAIGRTAASAPAAAPLAPGARAALAAAGAAIAGEPALRLVPATSLQLAQAAPAARSVPAAPSVPAGRALGLSQAYELALANDATLRAARAAAAARVERLPQARSQLLPQVTASANRFRNALESTSPDASGNPLTTSQRYTSGSRMLSMRQTIFNAQRQADVRQAQAQVAEAGATLEREVQTLAIRLVTAYMQALSAEDQLALVLTQKRAYGGQLESARRRLEGGSGTRTDIDEAQARLDMAVARELEARQTLDYTRRQLQILVDVPVGELALLDESRMPLVPPQPDRVEEWTRRAEETSPEIRALQAQLEAARREVDKARAGHLPTLDAVAQWSVSDSDNVTRVNSRYDQKLLGVQLNLPLYAGGLVDSQVRQALAEQQRVQENLEATRRDLGLRVHKEFRGVTEGVLRVRALEQAVRSAATVVESTRKSAQAGVRSLVDVLNAEEQRATAERDLADARYMYLLSRMRLRALAGEADGMVMEEAASWLRMR